MSLSVSSERAQFLQSIPHKTNQSQTMKKLNILFFALALMALSGCSIIGGIFKAGAAVGIIAVLVVIGVLIWIISLFRGK